MVRVNDLTRTAVTTGSPSGALRDDVANLAPNDTDWRLHDHCAAVTRLYTVYEEFVHAVLGEWLEALPALFGKYGDLPESVRKAYRVGTAEILSKFDRDRYAHLTEDQVIRGLADGLAGDAYSLGPDAFLTDERNLWRDQLARVFAQVGVADLWKCVSENRQVLGWEHRVLSDQTTLAAELDLLVRYRNEATHGSVSEILSPARLLDTAGLIRVLANALAEAMAGEHVKQMARLSRIERVGTVIREFSNDILGVDTTDLHLAVGDVLICNDHGSAYNSTIASIEIDHVPHDEIDCAAGTHVVIKVSRTARIGAEIWREQS